MSPPPTLKVDVSGNSLEALPAELGGLAKLATLHVARNRLRELPPELGGATALEEVTLKPKP